MGYRLTLVRAPNRRLRSVYKTMVRSQLCRSDHQGAGSIDGARKDVKRIHQNVNWGEQGESEEARCLLPGVMRHN